jgi:hypothetical protein
MRRESDLSNPLLYCVRFSSAAKLRYRIRISRLPTRSKIRKHRARPYLPRYSLIRDLAGWSCLRRLIPSELQSSRLHTERNSSFHSVARVPRSNTADVWKGIKSILFLFEVFDVAPRSTFSQHAEVMPPGTQRYAARRSKRLRRRSAGTFDCAKALPETSGTHSAPRRCRGLRGRHWRIARSAWAR